MSAHASACFLSVIGASQPGGEGGYPSGRRAIASTEPEASKRDGRTTELSNPLIYTGDPKAGKPAEQFSRIPSGMTDGRASGLSPAPRGAARRPLRLAGPGGRALRAPPGGGKPDELVEFDAVALRAVHRLGGLR